MEDSSYGSFAFWYKKKNKDSISSKSNLLKSIGNLEAVMNFNLWCECGWNTEPFLDIGFRLTHLLLAEELFFFIPLIINEKKKDNYIQDLGCKFNKTELVDSLFNRSYYTTIAANTKNIGVICSDARIKDEFNIYQLDIEHDIDLEYFANGTIIKIKTENILGIVPSNNSDDYYFRFRIRNIPLNFLIHKYNTPFGVLQGWFNTTYMIDFRYNNVRSLHKTLIEKFNEQENQTVNIKELHFFLMTKAYVDVANYRYKSIRKIEQNVWDDYVDNNDTNDLVAYHYVNKPTDEKIKFVTSSEIFTKFSVGRTAINKYIIAAIAFGAVGSILGNCLGGAIKLLIQWLIQCL